MIARKPIIGSIPRDAPKIFRTTFINYDMPRILNMFRDEVLGCIRIIDFRVDHEASYYHHDAHFIIIGLPTTSDYSEDPTFWYYYTLMVLMHEIGHHLSHVFPEAEQIRGSIVQYLRKKWSTALNLYDPEYSAHEVIACIVEIRGARRLGIPEYWIRRIFWYVYEKETKTILYLDRIYGPIVERLAFKP